MSFPFRAGYCPKPFNRLVEHFRSVAERFPDERTGDVTYSMADAALGAFAVFFTQSPSFLDFQRTLQLTNGCNNALSLFGVEQIPSDNHIRNLLDPVPPDELMPVFATVMEELERDARLEPYRVVNGDLLVAMDGTQYFSSTKIHCDDCSTKTHANGSITYSHRVVTPVIAWRRAIHGYCLWSRNLSPRRTAIRNRIARTPQPNAGWPDSVRVLPASVSRSWAMTSTASNRCVKPSAGRG
jgi:hypothetical protein